MTLYVYPKGICGVLKIWSRSCAKSRGALPPAVPGSPLGDKGIAPNVYHSTKLDPKIVLTPRTGYSAGLILLLV